MSVRVNRLPHNELREQLARSGQNAESFAADLAAQPELLAAAAELLKKRNGEVASIQSDLEAPATSAKKKSKKASKAVLDELLGGLKDGGTTTALGSASRKECKAAVRLAKHMQGDKRGQVSGKAFYTIVPCVSRLCACCLSTVCGSAMAGLNDGRQPTYHGRGYRPLVSGAIMGSKERFLFLAHH